MNQETPENIDYWQILERLNEMIAHEYYVNERAIHDPKKTLEYIYQELQNEGIGTTFERVLIRDDGDGHTYIIPYDQKINWDKYIDTEYFEELFGWHRIGGWIGMEELYIKAEST